MFEMTGAYEYMEKKCSCNIFLSMLFDRFTCVF